MNIQPETVWQPSAAAMRASRACALFATLVAGWLAGRALLDRSAFPLVEVGLVLSSLLVFAFARVPPMKRWDTGLRVCAWGLLTACAIGLVARVWSGAGLIGDGLGSIAAISLLAIGWALITPFRRPLLRLLERHDHERSTLGSDPIVEHLHGPKGVRPLLAQAKPIEANTTEQKNSVAAVLD